MAKRNFFKTNRIALHLGPIEDEVDYRLDSPFGRSMPVLLIVGVMAAIFTWIEISVLLSAIDAWRDMDELFMLVAALFQTFWLIAWSAGTLALCLAFVIIASGRMVLVVHSGRLDFVIGVPGIGFRISVAASEVTHVKLVDHDEKSMFPNQGKQLQIETDGGEDNTPFGSNMTERDVSLLQTAINRNKVLNSGLDQIPDEGDQPPVSTLMSEPEGMPATDSGPQRAISWSSPSSLLLIIANLVPLIGVALFNWDLGSIMVLYWAESAIILLYTVAKAIARNKVLGIFAGLFMTAHAGAFMVVHFLFIWTIFVQGINSGGSVESSNVSEVFTYLVNLWPALAALFISHGVSFKLNFLDQLKSQRGGKFKQDKDGFYSRIILMHVTIIFGGGAAMILGSGLPAMLLLVILKIGIDLRSHLKQHSGQPSRSARLETA